jgi:hypothetical protein
MAIRDHYRKYRAHISNRLKEDPFPTLVLYAIFLGLIFLLFALRGLVLGLFIPKVNIDKNAQPPQVEQPANNTTAPTGST